MTLNRSAVVVKSKTVSVRECTNLIVRSAFEKASGKE